jgi:hypothetical protein
LTLEQQERVKTVLQLGGKGVARAYLARRVLPADPSIVTHVMGLELKRWDSMRGHASEIVKRLSEFEWPAHVFICVLDGAHSVLGEKLKALPASEVSFES